MSEGFIVIIGFVVIILAQIWERRRLLYEQRVSFNRVATQVEDNRRLLDKSLQNIDVEREIWRRERSQLLDRIQAPSFDHLKHHEVKVIKAKSGEKDPIPLDPL